MTLFSATIEGLEIIPKIRLPLKMKWSKQGERYLKMKEALAWRLREHYREKEPMAMDMSLSCAVHFPNRKRRDLDNTVGSILDALMYAGIIADDSQVKEFRRCNIFHDGKARIVLILKRL